MNTPAHAILNLALLGKGKRPGHPEPVGFNAPILAGALLPDLPMFVFYGVQRLYLGVSESVIWNRVYFEPAWQALFDIFNSLPLAGLGLLLARAARWTGAQLFFASVALHCLLDLPLHREDAHGHFFPFTDWRFVSPVSYWDPAHHGAVAAALEACAVLGASVWLWQRHGGAAGRAVLVVVNALYLVGYATFYLALA